MKNLSTKDFQHIVLNNVPLIDVRAPIEYEKGAFPGSINLPIMNNEERHLVGCCYKEHGNEAATALGHQLVSGEIKNNRIQAWHDQLTASPQSILYCFRGGSRSHITQSWIKESLGLEVPLIEGGYKAFRNYLLQALEPSSQMSKPIILGGYTGSGKTILLKKLKNAIDLEGIANHRGSSFGQHMTPQPSQINFEHHLAYALIEHQAKGYTHMILEDEGRHIGHNFIPKELSSYFNSGKLVVVNTPLEERIAITLQEYVIDSQAEYIAGTNDIEKGLSLWYEYILASMSRLHKRLGGDRFQSVLDCFVAAYKTQLSHQTYDAHKDWISLFLTDYYDPMYAYQLQNTTKEIIFEGNPEEVLSFLNELG